MLDLYLLVGVLDLQSFLSRLVPELGEPLEEQRVRAGGQGSFATQPSRLLSWHRPPFFFKAHLSPVSLQQLQPLCVQTHTKHIRVDSEEEAGRKKQVKKI